MKALDRWWFATLGSVLSLSVPAGAQAVSSSGHALERPAPTEYLRPARWRSALREAAARGEIADPRQRVLPRVPDIAPEPLDPLATHPVPPCISSASLHLFEDTNQLLLTSFSDGELIDLMTQAANDLIATRGDLFDYIAYWIDFQADHEIGAAFYMPIENEVLGIGDASLSGTPTFNFRPDLGLASNRVDGYVMMWDVNHSYWAPGTDPDADFTRLAMGQEFEHRFAMFLPNLLGGRQLQGDDASCGRSAHWNWRVDGQGSGMEISEWVGANPASLVQSFVSFNTDIPGGVFSYTDLYLMGYVSPAEMDAGNSQLRYMNTSTCGFTYNGTISNFSSADIVASAGTRIPSSATSQKHWRTGWVMIHLPGLLPTQAEKDKAVGIMTQHMLDWNYGTLGRGTMNDTLFDECHFAQPYGVQAPANTLSVLSGKPALGTTLTLGVRNPFGTQSAGSNTFLIFSMAPDPNFPGGTSLNGFGMSAPGTPGELLINLQPPDPGGLFTGPPLPGGGAPAAIGVPVPSSTSLLGLPVYFQALIADPTVALGVRLALTNGMEIAIGP